ncbi:MAG: PIG-L family deacetylase [Euzebyales bacterium]|nr:PIG-L family deacetylase [Euzebyales bacterium]
MAPKLWQPVRPFSRALVVVAHPDDAEFGAAGTVARWVEMGTEVGYLVVTDGASGSADPAMTRERLVAIRQREQRAACAALGVRDATFLGHADGYLEATIEVRRQVAAAIRRQHPEVVVTLNPDVRWSSWGYINHPDHRAVGDLVLHAINPAASTRLYDTTLLDEGLEPWDVAELWLMSFGDGPDLVDVSATFDRKIAALRCHASQLSGWDPEPRMREMAALRGGEAQVGLAEAFTILRFRTLDEEGSVPVRDKPPTNAKPRR